MNGTVPSDGSRQVTVTDVPSSVSRSRVGGAPTPADCPDATVVTGADVRALVVGGGALGDAFADLLGGALGATVTTRGGCTPVADGGNACMATTVPADSATMPATDNRTNVHRRPRERGASQSGCSSGSGHPGGAHECDRPGPSDRAASSHP